MIFYFLQPCCRVIYPVSKTLISSTSCSPRSMGQPVYDTLRLLANEVKANAASVPTTIVSRSRALGCSLSAHTVPWVNPVQLTLSHGLTLSTRVTSFRQQVPLAHRWRRLAMSGASASANRSSFKPPKNPSSRRLLWLYNIYLKAKFNRSLLASTLVASGVF